MSDYISREAALEAQNKSMNLKECRTRLERLPAADVRPVVFCKDCKYYKDGKLLGPTKFCYYYKIGTGLNTADDDFCSKGERRIGNGKKIL